MIASSSRPTFSPLTYQPATTQLLVADATGCPALQMFLDAMPYSEGASREVYYMGRLHTTLPPRWIVRHFDTEATLHDALTLRFATLTMGTRLSISGQERFALAIAHRAESAGLSPSAICMASAGAITRCVQCVHCKTLTPSVSHRLLRCSGCGEELLVRDHYSRRLGAYQAVLAASMPALTATYRDRPGWT